jgi:hypothetical protein
MKAQYRKFRPQIGPCFWCNKVGNRTADHIPPKSLFPKRVHNSIPQAAACLKCNGKWTTDSEYFRDFLLSSALVDCTHPDLARVRDAFNRAPERRKSAGRRPFVWNVSHVWSQRGSGGVVRMSEMHSIDLNRIGNVIKTTAVLLHGLCFSRPMDDGNPTPSQTWSGDISPGPHMELARQAIAERGHTTASGLMGFAYVLNPSNGFDQEWVMSFYDTAFFSFRIAPQGIVDPPSMIMGGPGYKLNAATRPTRSFILDP